MKNLKKLVALLLALLMIMSIGLSVATETGDDETGGEGSETKEKGSITINNAAENNEYSIYKLMELESYTAQGQYSYKVLTEWMEFFTREDIKKYITVDSNNGYVSKWVGGDSNTEDPATFAKSALAYALEKNIAPKETIRSNGQDALVFDDLELGYYLIDSSMGALCGLTTTNPDASITAKNGVPVLEKQVKEDLTGNWGTSNTADIGQIIEFQTTITVHDGAQNYVLHDEMSAGLTYIPGSVHAQHVVSGKDPNLEATNVPPEYYNVITSGLGDECTFEVQFTEEFCEHIGTNDRVVVYYSARLDPDALVVVGAEGNVNEAWLSFGDNSSYTTTHSQTKTYTYAFDLVKTDNENKLLDGAVFLIYDAPTGGNVVPVIKSDDKNYKRNAELDVSKPDAGDDEVSGGTDVSGGTEGEKDTSHPYAIVVKDGVVRVHGFDNGTYYLEEIQTPQGYNELSARHRFSIADGNLEVIYVNQAEGKVSTNSGVHVINKTGTILPQTGGMGTTLFYIVGAVLVIAAVVVIITKKRMQNME